MGFPEPDCGAPEAVAPFSPAVLAAEPDGEVPATTPDGAVPALGPDVAIPTSEPEGAGSVVEIGPVAAPEVSDVPAF